MTGRERVIKAVKFQCPDRVPYDLPESFGSDFFGVGVDPDPGFNPKVEGEDEWGCVWEKLSGDKTMGQVKIHPLKDYSILDNYPFPNYDIPARYKTAKKKIKENKEGKFVFAHIMPLSFIHRLEYLRGHSEAWTDPYLNPEGLCRLLDIIADMSMKTIRHFAEIGIDGIISADDWGLQDRLMLSPDIFNRFFQPRYARVYKEAHKYGILTFLHSCGYIVEALDGLIEAGLDVIQMDQQENMGVENLSKRFGGKLCFWCPVDIQHTMVTGSNEDIRNYVKKLIWSFGRFNGGFIGKWYPSPEAVNHSREKIKIMSEAFIEFGKYPYVI